MAMKPIILITIFTVVLVATQAQAQFNLPPIPNVFPPIPNIFPPLPVLPPLPGVGISRGLNISGILSCSVNGSVNGTNPAPPFPNAVVQLVCGGNVVATTTTNGTGTFSIVLNQFQAFLSTILSNCILRVPTPLSNCNATLPSNGTLIAPLQFLGTVFGGAFNFTSGQFTLR